MRKVLNLIIQLVFIALFIINNSYADTEKIDLNDSNAYAGEMVFKHKLSDAHCYEI